jgi:hypothetical protein
MSPYTVRVGRLSFHIEYAAQIKAPATCLCISAIAIGVGLLALTLLSPDVSIMSNMSQASTAAASTSNYQTIFDNAIEAYKKKTKKNLRSHPLLAELRTCDSPDAVLNVFREKIPGFDQYQSTDYGLTKWLDPTINVLCKFSGFLGGGISLGSLIEFELTPSESDNWFYIDVPTSGGGLHWHRHPSLCEYFR